MKPAARKLDVFRGDNRQFIVRLWTMLNGNRIPLDPTGAVFELIFAGVTKRTTVVPPDTVPAITIVSTVSITELRCQFSTAETDAVSPDLGSTYSLVRTDGPLGRRTLLTGSLNGLDAPLAGSTDTSVDLTVSDAESVIEIEVTDSGVLSSAILGEMTELRDGAAGSATAASTSAASAAAAAAASQQLGTDLGVVVALRDGTAQDTQINDAVATFNTISGTADNAGAPAANARPLFFLAGNYLHAAGINIATPGTDNFIEGSGPAARLRGVSFTQNKSRSHLRNLYVSAAPVGNVDKIGFTVTGDLGRNRHGHNLVAQDRGTGFLFEGTAAWDSYSELTAFRGSTGFRVTGNNFQITNAQAVGQTGTWGWDWSGAQGFRGVNLRTAAQARFYGSSSYICIENYLTATSLTAGGRFQPCGTITNVANVGGYPVLTIVTKSAATMAAHGPIFQGGEDAGLRGDANRAEARIAFSGTAGSVSSILAGATELLTAPVPYNPTPVAPITTALNQTAKDIADAINANAATGYTAINRGPAVIILAPKADGFAANGRAIAATTAGGLTATFNKFVQFNWTLAHGFSATSEIPQFFEFDTAPHVGVHVVRYVPSTTSVVVEVADTTLVSGLAWKPHNLIPEEAGAIITNTGGVYDKKAVMRSVTDTTITLDMPFADLPALPAGARVDMPAWDLIYDALDTNNQRVNDIFLQGGNVNYLLILSGFNLVFNRTRLKRRRHIVKRANTLMQAEGVQFYGVGRGRATADVDQVPPVSGADTGWIAHEYNPGLNPGDGYDVRITPLKGAPLVNGKPQTIEARQYESKADSLYGDALTSSTSATSSEIANPHLTIPVMNVVIDGQSNAVGSDEAGSKVVEPGVYVWNGTAFIPAAFGTAPLNGGDSALGYANNFGVHVANNAIRSGVADRVNLIINAVGGISLSEWVATGTASPRFAALTSTIAAAGITEVHGYFWAQGERDSTTETTGYHTRDLYGAGFETLKAQLRAQSWFPRSTPIVTQELGTWYENNSQARNDYFQTIELGDDPYVTVSSAAGLTMATGANDAAHFSGDGLVKIGSRMWAAWLNLRLGMGQRVGFRTPEGFAVGRPRTISVSGATINVPVDDLRNGAIIDAANATINLPQAGLVPGAEVTVNVWSVSVSSTTLASIQNISDVPWQADALSVLLGLGTYVFKSIRSRWRFVSTNGATLGYRQSGTITVSTTYAMTAAEVADTSYIIAGSGTLVLPNPNGVTAQRGVVLRTSVPILLDVAAGGLYAGGGVYMLAGAPILIPAEQVIVLRPTEPSRWSIVGGTWRPERDQVIAQTAALTLTNNQSGLVYQNAGATARVDISLPAATAGLKYRFACMDIDGIRIVASTASADRIQNGASVSAPGGYIESTTIGSFIELVCVDNTYWYAIGPTGTWTVV